MSHNPNSEEIVKEIGDRPRFSKVDTRRRIQ